MRKFIQYFLLFHDRLKEWAAHHNHEVGLPA
jgi:hypothetical protein